MGLKGRPLLTHTRAVVSRMGNCIQSNGEKSKGTKRQLSLPGSMKVTSCCIKLFSHILQPSAVTLLSDFPETAPNLSLKALGFSSFSTKLYACIHKYYFYHFSLVRWEGEKQGSSEVVLFIVPAER